MEHENQPTSTNEVRAQPENAGMVRLETPRNLEQLNVLIEPHSLNGGAITPITPLSGGSSILDMQELYDFNEIDFKEKVGHGSYGTVYKAVLRERLVAVKEFEASAEPKTIETEVKQLSRVSHPNIIALYGVSFNVHSKYLIMEFAEGGSLHNFLHGKVKPYYTTAHAMSWARQCAEGVAYLHAMKPKPLIHRDLKPLNLLLTDKGRFLKICDFGTVVDKSTIMTNNRGSAAWMAPEVFEGKKYTEKCDIFSWAIVLWEMLTRQQPFKEIDNAYSIMWRIHQGDRPPLINDCPESIKNLMSLCWSKIPDDRPAMSHVVDLMNQLAVAFNGADEPLEYEFVNQQIIRPAGSDDDQTNYTMDFSSFNSSGNNTTLTHITASSPFNCDTISEEATDASSTSNSVNAFQGDCDAVSQSTESATSTAKSDGKNLLTVTDTKPFGGLPPNNTIATGGVSAGDRFIMNHPFGDESVEANVDSDNFEDDDDDDENDGPDQSLHEILDPELQPEPPIPGNEESEKIYREHRRLAKQYLQVDTKLYYAQDRKEKLLKEMDPVERKKREDLLTKMNTKKELLELYKSLSSQLERMHDVEPQQEHQQQQQPGEYEDDWVLVNTNSQNT